MKKELKKIYGHTSINIIPGIKGQRAFPTKKFKLSNPFLMLDHIGPQKVGKDYFLNGKEHAHPHRGFETLTFMFEGQMDHVDSLGNEVRLESGSVQRMNAGSGIIHGGDMRADEQTERFHEVQLWVDNPIADKLSAPDIQNVTKKEIPVVNFNNMKLRIISGEINDVVGPIKTKAATQIAHIIAKGAGEMEINGWKNEWNLMLYVLEGTLMVNEKEVNAYELATFEKKGKHISIRSFGATQALIMSGEPLNQPVVFGGPFVMTSEAEIMQAQKDFQQELFGTIN